MKEQLIFFLYDSNKKKSMFLVFNEPLSSKKENHRFIEKIKESEVDRYAHSIV